MNKWLNYNTRLESEFDDETLPYGDDQGSTQEAEEGLEKQTPQSEPAAFDYEALARATAGATREVMQEFVPRQEAKPLSEEEFARVTQKFVASDEFAKQFFGENATPQQTQALNQLLDGVYRHAYTSMGLALKAEIEPISGNLTKLQQREQERDQERFEANLIKGAPALAPYKPLVKHAIAVLKQSGYVPRGRTLNEQTQDANRQVMQFVEAQVKLGNPGFSLRSAEGNNGSRGGMPRMAGMTNGGSGGGSSSGAGGRKQSALLSVLG